MIAFYLLLLIVSIALFYFTSGVLPNTLLRVALVAAFFVILSTLFTVMLVRGHAPPEGARTVDMEAMKKTWQEHKQGNTTDKQ